MNNSPATKERFPVVKGRMAGGLGEGGLNNSSRGKGAVKALVWKLRQASPNLFETGKPDRERTGKRKKKKRLKGTRSRELQSAGTRTHLSRRKNVRESSLS